MKKYEKEATSVFYMDDKFIYLLLISIKQLQATLLQKVFKVKRHFLFFSMEQGVSNQTLRMMVSDYHRLWTLGTSKSSQVRCWPGGQAWLVRGCCMVLPYPDSLSETQRECYFTSVFSKAVVSLRSRRPIRTEE